MTITELQKVCLVNDSTMDEVKECHPKQIISTEIEVPVWRITYAYKTNRGNDKKANKYILLDESAWDLVDEEFKRYIEDNNEKYPERKVSNVEILDTEFMGKLLIPLE